MLVPGVNGLEDALRLAVRGALCSLALVDVVPVGPDTVRPLGVRPQWAQVALQVPAAGCLALLCDAALAAQFASLMSGDPVERMAPADGADALRELTNIIGGIVQRLCDGGVEHACLGVPTSGEGAPSLPSQAIGQLFAIGKHQLLVVVGLTDAALPPSGLEHDVDVDLFDLVNDESNLEVDVLRPTASIRLAENRERIPESLGAYRVLGEVGAGGMAHVYRARGPDGRLVAVKVPHRHLLRGGNYADRFVREGRLAQAIRHPRVARMLDAGVHQGVPFLVMRYIHGVSLSRLIRRFGPLNQADASRLFAACCGGLQAISDGGVLHRDLKPANILVTADGKPSICDFGLARPVTDDAHLTQVGMVIGTPGFMAPEQYLEAQQLDTRADIYGLGASLFCALSGRPPYTGASPADVMSQTLRGPIPDLAALRPDLDPRLVLVVTRCLAKEPDQRFSKPSVLGTVLAAFGANGDDASWVEQVQSQL
ncbi:MAG: serine/threonine-protein kinase [Planctomycetota bacterium]|jgi:hypothetical protein|nr:serine/threonine-protein kinase [Planctomycetota bacterium]